MNNVIVNSNPNGTRHNHRVTIGGIEYGPYRTEIEMVQALGRMGIHPGNTHVCTSSKGVGCHCVSVWTPVEEVKARL